MMKAPSSFGQGTHKSFKPGIQNEDFFTESGLGYSGKHFSALINHVYLGTNYYADVGFLNRIENYDALRDTTIRQGYHYFVAPISYRFLPKNNSTINQHGPEFTAEFYLDPKVRFLESINSLVYSFEFNNSSEFAIGVETK